MRQREPLLLLLKQQAAAAAVATVLLLVMRGDGAVAFSLPLQERSILLPWPSSINAAAVGAAAARPSFSPSRKTAAAAPAEAAAAAAAAEIATELREPLGTSRLLHVRLLAVHFDEMVRFYTQLLGMEVLGQWSSQAPVFKGFAAVSKESAPILWGPLGGEVTLPEGHVLPVDRVALLGYRGEEKAHGGRHTRRSEGLKLELIYSSGWARQQKEAEEKEAAAIRKEEADIFFAITAFEAHKNLQEHEASSCSNGSNSSNSNSSSNSGLPSLSRMRTFEKKRGRYDRGHHGYFGLTFLLPSLQHLQRPQVQQAGGRLLHCPAKRKQLPSMIPDQDARQELWEQSCFLFDPDGNGVEVQQLSSSSSCSSIGRSEKARKREAALNTWHSYMAEQEADISRQEQKQQLLHQLHEVEVQLQQLQQQQQQQQEVEKLAQQQQELQKKLSAFAEQQRIIDEIEQQRLQRQQEEEAAAAGAALQHKGPLSPRLQKVRLYTSSHLKADRFFGSTLQMELLRYKSHLLERLHPWTRFAATSRTYGCAAETLRAKADVTEGAEAAAATTKAALAAAGNEGLYGGGSNVPSEWEGPAATDPPQAAAEVFRTEAAERTIPHLQVAYAYDEDVVSVHPGFLHVALGVDDVTAAVGFVTSCDEAEAKAAASSATPADKCRPCSIGVSGTTNFGATEIVGDAQDAAYVTKVESQRADECLLRNFDGYPILLISKEQAGAYYQALEDATGKPQADS